jgi:DNA mismatch endonuclease (patch repair protein)
MTSNRRRDTTPELRLRSALHRRGYRFRVDMRIRTSAGDAPRPDLVFTRRRVAVFVDGCFWHGCADHGSRPKTNRAYWEPKLARNRQRDETNNRALEADGWTVLRIWEHEDLAVAVRLVENAVAQASSRSASRSR